eukprot:TRINITY_DN26643_c0_g1_i1.p1 TRINITY_DN26643_c0_g1~~TRINITY_DN26643_c0_g1_i1.p1  ORF type:complete len:973 (-),score=160.14 TRINITY_DN26643_c0_g1_i1:75-2993(-)
MTFDHVPAAPLLPEKSSRAQLLWRRALAAVSRWRQQPKQNAGPKRKLVLFDFDCTLTVVHVFKSLAGWVDSQVCRLPALGSAVPKPHALTERGQLRRISELGPAWVEQAFGGRQRIGILHELLDALRAQGVSVILVTRGYIGVAKFCLTEAGLMHFFERVYGNVGAAYGDKTTFDVEAETSDRLSQGLEMHLGRWDDAQWDSKNQVVAGLLQEKALKGDDVIFVDDDLEEVNVLKHSMPVVHVAGNAGLSLAEVEKLVDLLGQQNEPWALNCSDRWAALRNPLASKPFAIVVFNRKHLPVRVARHIALLEADFATCKNALRRVKMLLREPLLFCSVTQQAFVRHVVTAVDRPFSVKALQPVIQGMHAQLGLLHGELGSPAAMQQFAAFQRTSSVDSEEASKESRGMRVSSVDSENSGAGNLYVEPLDKPDSQQPLQTLSSIVRMFKQTLLGLCPITLVNAGLSRNVICCHEIEGTGTDTAVWARYKKIELLGAGHFGEVFKAEEVCNGRLVAVKQLERLSYLEDEYDEEQSEVSVLRALAHPNLLRIYEVVKSRDEIHIITELATGGTLSSYAKQNEDSRTKWIPGCMQQIVSAVAYCHNLHVLHGDLKPENVLICGQRPDGTPLCIVCDFGHTAICIGTALVAAPGDPRYIAPEVIAEEGLSPKSDIYMLGVTAYELLSGGWLPYFSERSCTLRMSYYQLKVGGVRERILSEDGLDWRDLDRIKSLAQDVREVVLQMLARHAADRPKAVDLLRCSWLQGAHGPCKTAYDAMLRADANNGWGLWVPQHPSFACRLESRSKTSWVFRMLLSIMGSGLDPVRVLGARLLFRRLDAEGNGLLSQQGFCAAAETAGLSPSLAKGLFQAADLHDQGYLDFKNLVMIFLDLDSFTLDELRAELASVVSRMRGPVEEEELQAAPSLSVKRLQSLLCSRPDARMLRWIHEINEILGPGDHVIDADCLLRVVLSDGRSVKD